MREKILLRIALICSVIGVVGLFFFSGNADVKSLDLGKIDSSDIGKEVKVIGTIERVSDKGKVMFLDVGQEKIETVSVVLFKEGDIQLNKGDYVELVGKLDNYEGKNSIIANVVKIK